MITWFLMLACSDVSTDSAALPAPTTVSGTTTSQTTPPQTSPSPALVDPADAVDLDPDPLVLHVALSAAPWATTIGTTPIDGYAYNQQIPGPTLRAEVGTTLVVDFTNDLPDPTTVHWHGVKVPWEMDGVTWQQDPILPGETKTISFPLTHAGTFWYHPHIDTSRQMDLGLYGALVVTDPQDPAMDEAVWVFDTWGEPQGADAHEHGPDPTARTWTVNSLKQPRFDAEQRAHRVRALNASNAGYLLLEDVTWFSMGHGISGSAQTGDLLLAPGERADLLWDRETSRELNILPYTAAGGVAFGDPMRVLDSTPAGVSPPLSFPEALPSPDPGYSDIVWVFEGDGDQLAWMINGETFPEITIPEVAFGSEPIVELRNLSAAEHPFHVHGIHFEVLSIDGIPPAHFTLADTVNLKIRQVVRLRLIADNPGDWMTHCHILPHVENGMMTVLRVQDP